MRVCSHNNEGHHHFSRTHRFCPHVCSGAVELKIGLQILVEFKIKINAHSKAEPMHSKYRCVSNTCTDLNENVLLKKNDTHDINNAPTMFSEEEKSSKNRSSVSNNPVVVTV